MVPDLELRTLAMEYAVKITDSQRGCAGVLDSAIAFYDFLTEEPKSNG
jgi:hypothetical protein